MNTPAEMRAVEDVVQVPDQGTHGGAGCRGGEQEGLLRVGVDHVANTGRPGDLESQGAELALLTDMSAACGSQVISLGCRLQPDSERRWQKGVGVATALLLQAGIPVISQRDYQSLGLLRRRLEPGFELPAEARDHHQHPWTLSHLPVAHPRA